MDLSLYDDVAEMIDEVRHATMCKEREGGRDSGYDLRDEVLALTAAVKQLASLTRDKLSEVAPASRY